MNWKEEAKEKLRRYSMMKAATISIPEELERLEMDIQSVRGVRTDGIHVKSSGGDLEDVMLGNIVLRQELSRNLKQSQIWVTVTVRALGVLTEEERSILHRLYIYPERGGLERLRNELGCRNSTVYRKRDNALRKFTIALYGAEET